MKSIRWIKVKLQETIKPSISNKSKNILGVDRVEQFMQGKVWQSVICLRHIRSSRPAMLTGLWLVKALRQIHNYIVIEFQTPVLRLAVD